MVQMVIFVIKLNLACESACQKMQQFYSLGGADCIANYDAVHYYLHQGQKNAVKIAAQLAV